jgi:hypothetical protein
MRECDLGAIVDFFKPLYAVDPLTIAGWSASVTRVSQRLLEYNGKSVQLSLFPKQGSSENFQEYLRSLVPKSTLANLTE